MTTLTEVGPGSFDAYEGIRVVIPGLLTYGIGVATFRTLAPSEKAGLLENPLAGIVAGLAIGLLLYFLDIPARAAAYSKGQPTDYLNETFPKIDLAELRTAYFLILNTLMPANTRNRALYMGSMFRIGLEMIIALAIATSAVLGANLLNYGPQRGSYSLQANRIGAVFLCIVFLVALWTNAASGPSKVTRRLKNLLAGIKTRSMVVYGVGILLMWLPWLLAPLAKIPFLQDRWFAVLGLAICTAYWIWRYVRGDSSEATTSKATAKPRRQPLDSLFAGALFLVPAVLALSIYTPGDKSVLSSVGYLVGWTAAAALVIAMVVGRGHERKLHGVYVGQTRWLKDNGHEVSIFLGVTQLIVPSAGSASLKVDVSVADVRVNRIIPGYQL